MGKLEISKELSDKIKKLIDNKYPELKDCSIK